MGAAGPGRRTPPPPQPTVRFSERGFVPRRWGTLGLSRQLEALRPPGGAPTLLLIDRGAARRPDRVPAPAKRVGARHDPHADTPARAAGPRAARPGPDP